MKKLLIPFWVIYKVYCLVVFVMLLILFFPLFAIFLSRKKWFPKAFKLIKVFCYVIQPLILIFVVKKTAAEFPKGAFVLCCNHTSYMDIVLMYCVVPSYFIFMGKAEILSWPLMKIFFKEMNIAVDRKNSREALKALKRSAQELKNGIPLVIFPEGTIPKDKPKLNRFKNGAFKLAIECQVPVVTMTYLSNWKLLSDEANLLASARPGLSKVILHQAISTKGMTEKDIPKLKDAVYELIDNDLKNNK